MMDKKSYFWKREEVSIIDFISTLSSSFQMEISIDITTKKTGVVTSDDSTKKPKLQHGWGIGCGGNGGR